MWDHVQSEGDPELRYQDLGRAATKKGIFGKMGEVGDGCSQAWRHSQSTVVFSQQRNLAFLELGFASQEEP